MTLAALRRAVPEIAGDRRGPPGHRAPVPSATMWTRFLRIVLVAGALAASSVVATPGPAGADHTTPAVLVIGSSTKATELGNDCEEAGDWSYRSDWIADNETQARTQGYGQDCGWIAVLVFVSFRDANPAVQVRPNSVELIHDYIVIVGGGSCTAHRTQSVVLSDPNPTGLFLENERFTHRVQACGGTLTFEHDLLWSCLETPTHHRCG